MSWAPPPLPCRSARELFDDVPVEVPGSVSAPLQAAARKQVQRSIAEALDIELAEVLVRGWLGHRALRAAAERTRGGGRELVELAEHTIVSAHRPTIDLTLNGAPLATLHLTLQMSMKVIGAIAAVERSSLTGVQSGAIEVTAALMIENDQVASRTRRIDAAHTVQLTQPRPLLPPVG